MDSVFIRVLFGVFENAQEAGVLLCAIAILFALQNLRWRLIGIEEKVHKELFTEVHKLNMKQAEEDGRDYNKRLEHLTEVMEDLVKTVTTLSLVCSSRNKMVWGQLGDISSQLKESKDGS